VASADLRGRQLMKAEGSLERPNRSEREREKGGPRAMPAGPKGGGRRELEGNMGSDKPELQTPSQGRKVVEKGKEYGEEG